MKVFKLGGITTKEVSASDVFYFASNLEPKQAKKYIESLVLYGSAFIQDGKVLDLPDVYLIDEE